MDNNRIVDDDSWSITFSQKDKCIHIQTSDYHAEPLKISKSQLTKLAGMFEPVRKDDVKTHKPTQPSAKPSDILEITTQNGWTVGISKKNKLLFCESKDKIAEPLIFSRNDLYRYGKMMNKRVRIKK